MLPQELAVSLHSLYLTLCNTAWVHPIAHTPDLRLSLESPHVFHPSPCQSHEPCTPPGQPPLHRLGSHHLQKFKCNSTKDNLKLVPLFCFSLHNNDKKDQRCCQYWNFYMLLLWKFQEAICLVKNPYHRLPVSNWYLKRKENQAFNLGRSHLSLYQVRELGCRLGPGRGSPKAKMPPASHPGGGSGEPFRASQGREKPCSLPREGERSFPLQSRPQLHSHTSTRHLFSAFLLWKVLYTFFLHNFSLTHNFSPCTFMGGMKWVCHQTTLCDSKRDGKNKSWRNPLSLEFTKPLQPRNLDLGPYCWALSQGFCRTRFIYKNKIYKLRAFSLCKKY